MSRDAQALDGIAAEAAVECVSSSDHRVFVDRVRFRKLHSAVASRVIRIAAIRLMPENHREFTFERAEHVRLAASGRTGAVIELPYRVVARIERETIVIERRNP